MLCSVQGLFLMVKIGEMGLNHHWSTLAQLRVLERSGHRLSTSGMGLLSACGSQSPFCRAALLQAGTMPQASGDSRQVLGRGHPGPALVGGPDSGAFPAPEALPSHPPPPGSA